LDSPEATWIVRGNRSQCSIEFAKNDVALFGLEAYCADLEAADLSTLRKSPK